MAKRYDILRLDPQDKPVYFIVEAFNPDDRETTAYYYKGGCPTNFIRRVNTIIVDGDTDPHGLFEFVRTTDALEFLEKGHSPEEE